MTWMKMLGGVMAVAALLVGPAMAAEEAPLNPALFDARNWGIGSQRLRAVASDEARHKLYVGLLSYETDRNNLWVFDLEVDGTVKGQPRVYRDHPDALTPGCYSAVGFLKVDRKHNKLFAGIEIGGKNPGRMKPLKK